MVVVVPLIGVVMLILVPALPLSRLEEVLNGSPRAAPGPAMARSLSNKLKQRTQTHTVPAPLSGFHVCFLIAADSFCDPQICN